MQPVTLKAVLAKQTELATMIQQLQDQASSTTLIEIGGCTITLQPGEHYSGSALDDEGQHKYHLVEMAARPPTKLNHQAAMAWAASIGGTLPTRQELSLLFANCKPHLKPECHWGCETHEDDASFAWFCYFTGGGVGYDRKCYEGAAVAVRRV